MEFDPQDMERMNNYMLKGVYATNAEMKEAEKSFSKPWVIIIVGVIFVLCLIGAIAK